MTAHEQDLQNYLLLAATAHQKRQQPGRDRFLMLAIEQALHLGHLETAEIARRVLIQDSPHHLLARYPDVATAARSEMFGTLIRQLKRNCNPERAEQLARLVQPSPADRRSGEESREESLRILQQPM